MHEPTVCIDEADPILEHVDDILTLLEENQRAWVAWEIRQARSIANKVRANLRHLLDLCRERPDARAQSIRALAGEFLAIRIWGANLRHRFHRELQLATL